MVGTMLPWQPGSSTRVYTVEAPSMHKVRTGAAAYLAKAALTDDLLQDQLTEADFRNGASCRLRRVRRRQLRGTCHRCYFMRQRLLLLLLLLLHRLQGVAGKRVLRAVRVEAWLRCVRGCQVKLRWRPCGRELHRRLQQLP